MTVHTSARPALIALAIAAISGACVLLWHRRSADHADSIEPRRMPGSAADIHVSGGVPLKRR